MRKHYPLHYLCILVLLSLAYACTKTATITPPAPAGNRIISYKITNVQGDPLYGAVNDTDSSITVYLPYYLYLTILAPEIQISEGARVEPATGSFIENLPDLFTAGRDIRYTVTGKDSSKFTYKLHIEVQQPRLSLTELSPDATTPAVYFTGSTAELTGNNFIVNNTLTKVSLVDKTGKETSTDQAYLYVSGPSQLYFAIPTVPAGQYYVKIYSYSQWAVTNYPIEIQ